MICGHGHEIGIGLKTYLLGRCTNGRLEGGQGVLAILRKAHQNE